MNKLEVLNLINNEFPSYWTHENNIRNLLQEYIYNDWIVEKNDKWFTKESGYKLNIPEQSLNSGLLIDVTSPEYVAYVKQLRILINDFSHKLKDINHYVNFCYLNNWVTLSDGSQVNLHKILVLIQKDIVNIYKWLIFQRVFWKKHYKAQRQISQKAA